MADVARTIGAMTFTETLLARIDTRIAAARTEIDVLEDALTALRRESLPPARATRRRKRARRAPARKPDGARGRTDEEWIAERAAELERLSGR